MPVDSNKLRIKLKYDLLWLLIALSLLIFIPSFIPSGIFKTTIIYSTLVLSFIFSIISLSINNRHLYVSIILAILTLVSNIIPVSSEHSIVFAIRMMGIISFFSYTAIMILYRIARARKISMNIIYGAIAGYLLMGILGGGWSRFVEFLYPNSFSMPDGWTAQLDTLTYFSFVTMSSLGYGDISPISAPGRSTAIFISISGQMYLTITIALLVGSYSRNFKHEED